MDPSNVINLSLLGVTAVAAIVSIIAVVDARRSRADAAEQAADAKTEADRATSAAEGIRDESARIAEGIAAMNEREDARESRRLPWVAEKVGSDRWRVVNNTGATAEMVEFKARPPATIEMEDRLSFRDVAPGQPVFITFGGYLGAPNTADVVIEWWDALRAHHEAMVVLH
jgi:hypothetical protein